MAKKMLQLLMVGSLLFIIFQMIVTWKLSTDDPQEEQVFRGLAFAIFVISAFSAGSWLMGAMLESILDNRYITLLGWVIGGLLVLLLLDQGSRHKAMPASRQTTVSGKVITENYFDREHP